MSALMRLIDCVIPPRCVVTGEIVDVQGTLSAQAWGGLHFISDPQCDCCGYPFDFDMVEEGIGGLCAACQKEHPIYNKARSALVYDDASRDIILSFKHGDQTQSVPVFIPWLSQTGKDFLEGADYLIPVPLHRWRLLKRRFNQSAIITQYLSKDIKVPCLLEGLRRVRPTETQGHLQASQRRKNAKNAFEVNPACLSRLKEKNIVLIDDVYTTGATVSECTKALLKAGVSKVNVLTLARVVKPVRD
jgi:ComF family protein